MKTRNGFVSNSSSSSFVIAQRKDAKYQLTEFFGIGHEYCENSITAQGKDAVVAAIQKDCGDDDSDEYWKPTLAEVEKTSDEYTVLYGNLDQNDETMAHLLSLMKKHGDIVVIYGEF